MDAYTVFNLNFRYKLPVQAVKGLVVQGRVYNLFNKRYLMYGSGEEFFPAATRNGFIGLQFEL